VPVVREQTPVVPMTCQQRQIELTLGGQKQSVCVGDVSSVQNGSVRRYQVDAVDSSQRWLRIEAVGSTVLSAALGLGVSKQFQCRESDCAQIAIGRRDVQGVRVISLRAASLSSVSGNEENAVVSGELSTSPEDRLPGLACTDQGLNITTSDSSSFSFCPKGGAGFELGSDGNKTYQFTSLDGESIRVAVDQNERVKQVVFQGDSTLACKSAACGIVRLSAVDRAGERTFTFAGTTLIETSKADRNAVLNGTLILPAL
jgi:hypothetical protein